MAPRAVLVTILAYLAISGSTSPLDIAPQTLWKRSFASCPGGKQPSDDNSQGIKACSLPSFNCPSAGAQAAQIAGVKADPKFFAIATLENAGPNCDAGKLEIPTVNTKPGQGAATNCGFFNNNLAAINKYCPGDTCDSLKDLGKASSCMQKQIDGFGGFDKWAQIQRCGHLCSTGEDCGDPSKGVQCTSSSADYVSAVNYINSQNNANEGKGKIGNAWLIGI